MTAAGFDGWAYGLVLAVALVACEQETAIEKSCRQDHIAMLGKSAFRAQCETMVKEHLLSPTSAKFHGLGPEHIDVMTTSDCGRSWNAVVDSKNAYGTEVRSRFLCTSKPRTNEVQLDWNVGFVFER
jgi:hypothetical protein